MSPFKKPKHSISSTACDESYRPKKQSFLRFMFEHRREMRYKCNKCKKSFVSLCQLRTHKIVHNLNRQLFICTLCSKFFQNEKLLKIHKSFHEDEKQFTCDICSKSFVIKLKLQNKTLQDDLPLICDACTKKFLASYNSEPSKKSQLCQHCGKCFNQERCLKANKKTRLEKREFKCKYCSKKFYSKICMEIHSNLCNNLQPNNHKLKNEKFVQFTATSDIAAQMINSSILKSSSTDREVKNNVSSTTSLDNEKCPKVDRNYTHDNLFFFDAKSGIIKPVSSLKLMFPVIKITPIFVRDYKNFVFKINEKQTHHNHSIFTISSTSRKEKIPVRSNARKKSKSVETSMQNINGFQIEQSSAELSLYSQANSSIADSQKSPSYVCKRCLTEFPEKSQVINHDCPAIKIKFHTCDFCLKLFRSKKKLEMHRHYHMPFVATSLSNSTLKDPSTPKHTLSYHRNVAMDRRATKPSQCIICLTKGSQEALGLSAEDHILYHAAISPYQCKSCGMGFMSYLQFHKHRSGHVRKSYRCKICSQIYTQEKECGLHVKTHGCTDDSAIEHISNDAEVCEYIEDIEDQVNRIFDRVKGLLD